MNKLLFLCMLISSSVFANEHCDMKEKITTHTIFNLVSYDLSKTDSSVETKRRLCTTVECTSMVDNITNDIYNNKEYHLKGSSQRGFPLWAKYINSVKCP